MFAVRDLLLLECPSSPLSLLFSPTPASLVMAEISPSEYLTMANQAYVVAYVTGPVHPPTSHRSISSIFLHSRLRNDPSV